MEVPPDWKEPCWNDRDWCDGVGNGHITEYSPRANWRTLVDPAVRELWPTMPAESQMLLAANFYGIFMAICDGCRDQLANNENDF